MLKGHPKGLLVAFFANMGERFGFYTMMGILVLFLQAKFGLSGTNAGLIYSVFYAAIYALALVGGIIADRFIGLKKTITLGIIFMGIGYVLIAIPGLGIVPVCGGLLVIAFGNGLFKGNLQAVVGNLYEDKKYAHLRDSAFSIFYMGINIGGLFAPSVAAGILDYFLKTKGFGYNAELPAVCHNFLANGSSDTIQAMADKVSLTGPVSNLTEFAQNYIDAFATGYNYAFGFAAIMMVFSLIVYFLFNKHLNSGFSLAKAKASDGTVVEMSKAEEKERFIALGLVFAVVIFFWMSFHQNGVTLTFFARDYTQTVIPPVDYFWFDLKVLLPFFFTALGIYFLIKFGAKASERLIGAAMLCGFGYLSYYTYTNLPAENTFSPVLFQHMNPFFIVALTPIIVGVFSHLRKKGTEPTAPRKIGIGMILAALGFVVLLVGSLGLPSQIELGNIGAPEIDRVSPYWLISTYFVLTIAELFLSPMGISFVSKVAPPRFKGIMQGLWLCATALGNQLLFVGALLYEKVDLWILWAFFVVCCLASATFIFSVMKKIEKVSK